ncbi:hypothetical protein B0H13DRAFT_2542657 [Mycena leptocephala]|nr:hypothetical protein B0H13DRAFT_2542657 [Mycena leptocephala]
MGNPTRSRWDEGSQKVHLHCARVIIQQHFSRIISPIYTADTARVDRLDDAHTAQISILALPTRTCASRQETSVSHDPSTLVPMSIPLPHTIARPPRVPPAPSHQMYVHAIYNTRRWIEGMYLRPYAYTNSRLERTQTRWHTSRHAQLLPAHLPTRGSPTTRKREDETTAHEPLAPHRHRLILWNPAHCKSLRPAHPQHPVPIHPDVRVRIHLPQRAGTSPCIRSASTDSTYDVRQGMLTRDLLLRAHPRRRAQPSRRARTRTASPTSGGPPVYEAHPPIPSTTWSRNAHPGPAPPRAPSSFTPGDQGARLEHPA